MIVRQIFLIFLFYYFETTNQNPNINYNTLCDKKIMRSFKLKGFKHPMTKLKPEICPSVIENCCTLLDELSIAKLWKEHTLPQINYHVNQTVLLYQKLFNLKDYLTHFDFNMINFHYIKPKRVYYKKTYCNFKESTGDKYVFNHFKQIKDLVQKKLLGRKLFKKKKQNKFIFMSRKEERNLTDGQQIAIKNLELLMKKYKETYDNVSKKFDDYVNNRGRKLLKNIKNVVVRNLKVQNQQLENYYKDYFEQSRRQNIKLERKDYSFYQQKFLKSQERKLNIFKYGLFQQKLQFSRPEVEQNPFLYSDPDTLDFFSYHNFNQRVQEKNSAPSPNADSLFGDFPTQKNQKIQMPEFMIKFQSTPYWDTKQINKDQYDQVKDEFLKNGKIILEDLKDDVSKQSFIFQDFMDQLKNFISYETYLKKKQFMESGNQSILNSNFISNVIKQFMKSDLEFLFVPNPPKLKADIKLHLPPFYGGKYKCYKKSRKTYRYIAMVNQAKFQTCKISYSKIQALNNIDMNEFLKQFMKEMTYIYKIKGGIYCAACDATKQKFISDDKQQIFYTSSFCRNLILSGKQYLTMVNILMVDLADAISQFLNCIQTDAKDIRFPIKTIFYNQKLKIEYFEQCFLNINDPDFMKYCYFICRDFKINGSSQYFDGNLRVLYGMYTEILEFLQAYHIPYEYHQNVNPEYLENLDKEFYDFQNRKLNQDLQPDTTLYTGNASVYDNVKHNLDLENMQSVFLDKETGIDLLKSFNRSNLDINMDEFVKTHFMDREKKSAIQSQVIKKFFDASDYNKERFNSDIDQIFDERKSILDSAEPQQFMFKLKEKNYPEKNPDLSNPIYNDQEIAVFLNKQFNYLKYQYYKAKCQFNNCFKGIIQQIERINNIIIQWQ